MASYSPPKGSITHLEFTNTNQSVSVVNEELQQYRINNVTYRTSNGIRFDDFVLNVTGTRTWNYKALLKYAVDRSIHYSTLSADQKSITKHRVNNVVDLPKDYQVAFRFENPAESMNIIFDIVGETRIGHHYSNPDTGSSYIQWSDWHGWSDTYTVTVETNINKHCQIIRQVVLEGKFCQNSPIKPEI